MMNTKKEHQNSKCRYKNMTYLRYIYDISTACQIISKPHPNKTNIKIYAPLYLMFRRSTTYLKRLIFVVPAFNCFKHSYFFSLPLSFSQSRVTFRFKLFRIRSHLFYICYPPTYLFSAYT